MRCTTLIYVLYLAACDCDVIGSTGRGCDVNDGQCSCKPLVADRRCDRCDDNAHSFTDQGCQGTNTSGIYIIIQ
jgi:hypothetical protein